VPMPDAFKALLLRHAQLGVQLPQDDDDLDLMDPHELASVKLLVNEMRAVERQIWAYLADVKSRRRVA
jgi:hypothetical protein